MCSRQQTLRIVGDNERVTVAGWPVARQHPRGRNGTVFVTIEDETGDVQVIVWSDLFARRRRELGSQVVEVTGTRIEMGRDYERDSDRPARRPVGSNHAGIPRLALRMMLWASHWAPRSLWYENRRKHPARAEPAPYQIRGGNPSPAAAVNSG